VLGLAAAREQVLPDGDGNAGWHVELIHTFDPAASLADDPGPAPEQDRRPLRLSEITRVQYGSGCRAESYLAGVGTALHRHRLRRRRTCDDQLTVEVSDEEEVEVAAVNADRHA